MVNVNVRTAGKPALAEAYRAAFPPGEYVGQEGFMTAGEIVALAEAAGIGPGTTVVDICCGTGGPGALVAARTGCRYHGIDADAEALAVAQDRMHDFRATFTRRAVPPLAADDGVAPRYDVALLLETMLAFRDKTALVRSIADAVKPGGRLACTIEEGEPLTGEERASMPDADTVWPVSLGEFSSILWDNGFRVIYEQDHTERHRRVVGALVTEIASRRDAVARSLGAETIDRLGCSHRLWSRWLAERRIRKVAIVAEKDR